MTASRSAGGELLVGPHGVVPASALEPWPGGERWRRSRGCALHLGEGWDVVEVDGELVAAGVGDVGVGVVETGHGEGAVEVDDFCLWGFEFQDVGVGSGGQDFSVGCGDGGDVGRGGAGVRLAEVGAGEDVAVDVDGVGELGQGDRGGGAEDRNDGKGFHVVECIKLALL